MAPQNSSIQGASTRSAALAAALAALVLLPLLGHKPLTDWDEGIYAEVSREMLTLGWLIPHWNYQVWLEKPPLMLWITAVLYRGFGVSELTARLGSALSGVGLVVLLHSWLERRRNLLTAWLSTVMLLACFGFLHICRVGEMDTLLSLGCVLGLIGLGELTCSNPRGWLLFWSGAAIAVMTKGAASVTLFIAAVLLLVTGRWPARHNTIRRAEFWFGALLFLALTVPWHLAMYLRFGHSFLAEYLGFHVLSRATEQIEGHSTHWWFYLKVLLVSAPPFALLYPFAALRSLRTGLLRAFALFGLVELIFFTAVQTRLPHYIAPAYPAFTVVTADLLAVSVARYSTRPRVFWIKAAAVSAAICAVAILVTSRPRSSLHSAVLSNGSVLPDNKDAVAVLRHAQPQIQSIPGPLLVLRNGPAPLNVDIFYARRPAHQIQLAPVLATAERDRYINNPIPLSSVVAREPTLLLVDRSLQPGLPADLRFSLLQQGREVDLGLIEPIPRQP